MNKLLVLEQMAALTTSMVEQARHGVWDDLVALEQQEARLATQLNQLPNSAATAKQEAALIRQILNDHENVRSYVDPWREQVQPLLRALAPQAE